MKGGVAAATLLPLALSMITASKATGPTCGTQCGTERWPVKTLSDVDARSVNMTPIPITVSELVAAPAPSESSNDTRLNDIEKETLTVNALLMGFKLETDHDFHLVIEDARTHDTMIAEIPDPQCSGVCASIAHTQIAQTRSGFAAAFAATPPDEQYTALTPPLPVTLMGVGFFDFYHGQTGVARNCIELHPVLTITLPQGARSARRDPAAEPTPGPTESYHCLPE